MMSCHVVHTNGHFEHAGSSIKAHLFAFDSTKQSFRSMGRRGNSANNAIVSYRPKWPRAPVPMCQSQC
jgi:hypothetical protein